MYESLTASNSVLITFATLRWSWAQQPAEGKRPASSGSVTSCDTGRALRCCTATVTPDEFLIVSAAECPATSLSASPVALLIASAAE